MEAILQSCLPKSIPNLHQCTQTHTVTDFLAQKKKFFYPEALKKKGLIAPSADEAWNVIILSGDWLRLSLILFK